MNQPFLQAIHSKPLLADGGMGTVLYSRGASTEGVFEQLNETRSELVLQVHIDYLNAGAEIIETNSFSGNRFRLGNYGLGDQVWGLNLAAAKIARNAREIVGQPAFIAGAIGPTGQLLPPLGEMPAIKILEAFKEQMGALLAGGVDLFIIETMSSLEETKLAIQAARELSTLPIVAQLSFSVEGRTLFGASPEDAIKLVVELADSAPDVIGINCGAGPGPVFDSLLRMTEAAKLKGISPQQLTFSCLPNAGQPSLAGGRYQFLASPEYCASYVVPYIHAGAHLIGGCCGTTPAHIKAMRKVLDLYLTSSEQIISPGIAQSVMVDHSKQPIFISGKPEAEKQTKEQTLEGSEQSLRAKETLAARLREIKEASRTKLSGDRRFFVSVELDPPKGPIAKKLLQAAKQLVEAGADAINVGDSPMARVRMSSMATCQLISEKVGLETIIHFTTRDRNLMGIQADLLGCQALGINNILALTGDPPTLGNYVHATAVYDVDSVGLIKIIKQLNNGLDIAGNTIGSPTNLSIGCALNANAEGRQQEIERFKRKLEAGADFVMTQPIYQKSDLADFFEVFGNCPVPLLVGIMPLHSFRHAEYLHNEVPGISIPEHIRTKMNEAQDQGATVGLELAMALIEEIRPLCQGIYLVPSFGRYDDMCSLLNRIKDKPLVN
jgi:methionine synthase / methylenetetrahydrofolate reductase(NADPH)